MRWLKENFWLVIILLTAVIVRLIYIFWLQPPFSYIDAQGYDWSAWNLVSGRGYASNVDGTFYASREPGYALFFLAPIYYLFGHSWLAAQMLQVLISIGIVTLVFFLSKKYLSKKIALIASFLYAIFPSAIVYPGEILTETAFSFLLLSFLFLFLLSIKDESWIKFFLSGLLLGLATLTRFITIFFPFVTVLILYVYFKNWRRAISFGGLILLGAWLVVAPWLIKLYFETGSFVFGRLGGGVMYWSGSQVATDGEWIDYDPEINRIREKLGDVSDVEVDRHFISLTLQNIKSDPVGVALVWLKKPFKIFLRPSNFRLPSRLQLEGGVSQCFENKGWFNECAIIGLMNGFYWFLFFGSLVGCQMLFKDNKKIALFFLFVIFYFFIFYMPMSPAVRYRHPLLPYLFILAAVYLSKFEDGFRKIINKLSTNHYYKQ